MEVFHTPTEVFQSPVERGIHPHSGIAEANRRTPEARFQSPVERGIHPHQWFEALATRLYSGFNPLLSGAFIHTSEVTGCGNGLAGVSIPC